MDTMKTILLIIILLLTYSEQADAQTNDDFCAQIEIDSVSVGYDTKAHRLVVDYTFCHPGYYSTRGYTLRSGNLVSSANIDHLRPVEAEIPRHRSHTFPIPHQWYQVDSLQIELKIIFELYDTDSSEAAEKIGGCTYCDSCMVQYK